MSIASTLPYTLHLGDCLAVLRAMPDNSVDSIVTDPPYGLAFMGKRWDYDVPSVEVWAECLRVLRPGGHLLAFAGTRTQHRMAVRIEDAGFEIRDMIAWVYGSGFPKSLDVSKAIDKAAGAEREVIGSKIGLPGVSTTGENQGQGFGRKYEGRDDRPVPSIAITAPATDAARQWQGWGTALKPALEPITVARKPLVGTVAANVLAHGTGALNIDGCRVETDTARPLVTSDRRLENNTYSPGLSGSKCGGVTTTGRWPANLIHDGSEEVLAGFPLTTSGSRAAGVRSGFGSDRVFSSTSKGDGGPAIEGSTGSAARFFYAAKASRKDRNEGCEHMEKRALNWSSGTQNPGSFQPEGTDKSSQNHHPTVKPTDLMAYLCRLVTPPGGVVLDPFMGSGSTGKAALREGFRFIGCERDPAYLEIATARIEHEWRKNAPAVPVLTPEQSDLFGGAR